MLEVRFLGLDLIVSYFETERLVSVEAETECRAVSENLDFVGKGKLVRMENT